MCVDDGNIETTFASACSVCKLKSRCRQSDVTRLPAVHLGTATQNFTYARPQNDTSVHYLTSHQRLLLAIVRDWWVHE